MENKVYRFQLFGGLILRVEDRSYVHYLLSLSVTINSLFPRERL